MRHASRLLAGLILLAAIPAAAQGVAFQRERFGPSPTASEIANAWAQDGFSCMTTNLTAFYDVERVNITDERIAVIRGGLKIAAEGATYVLLPGDAIHLASGTRRRQTTGNRPVSIIAFGYGPYDSPKNQCR